MKKQQLGYFYYRLRNKNQHYPWCGQIELTYRCNLNCIHCYCKGNEDKKKELTTQDWKKILDEIYREGCIWLTLTGGEPLVREDFLELYAYAKEKGFLITIFSNGQGFTSEIIDYLAKSPPLSIELTLNGITPDIYEAITQIEGSFSRVMKAIKRLAGRKIFLILKTNCIKQNKHQLAKIKAFTEQLLGKPQEKKYHFKYDSMIYPRLNRDKTPCSYRLSFEELLEVRSQDPDIWQEYREGLRCGFPELNRDRNFLYRCNAWMQQFFISPYGRLKFCMFSDKFSVDLKTTSFKTGFYEVFPQVLKEQFKTNSKCRDCTLRPICYNCPARAYLETGDEEAPVLYLCELAQKTAEQMGVTRYT
jgi:radical SAM protein with 4Fe4S-binding SPASM domain